VDAEPRHPRFKVPSRRPRASDGDRLARIEAAAVLTLAGDGQEDVRMIGCGLKSDRRSADLI
jgi:hypothetical protein